MGNGSIVVTIDPGKATGWSICRIYRTVDIEELEHESVVSHPMFAHFKVQVLDAGAFEIEDGPAELLKIMTRADTWAFNQVVTVVIEKFIVTQQTMQTQATWSSEVIGMVKSAATYFTKAHRLDITQKPNGMKGLIHKNKVLQTLGLTKRGDKKTDHEKDALGHAILYAVRLHNGETRLPKKL